MLEARAGGGRGCTSRLGQGKSEGAAAGAGPAAGSAQRPAPQRGFSAAGRLRGDSCAALRNGSRIPRGAGRQTDAKERKK